MENKNLYHDIDLTMLISMRWRLFLNFNLNHYLLLKNPSACVEMDIKSIVCNAHRPISANQTRLCEQNSKLDLKWPQKLKDFIGGLASEVLNFLRDFSLHMPVKYDIIFFALLKISSSCLGTNSNNNFAKQELFWT